MKKLFAQKGDAGTRFEFLTWLLLMEKIYKLELRFQKLSHCIPISLTYDQNYMYVYFYFAAYLTAGPSNGQRQPSPPYIVHID